jgi:hypothetical protein
VIEILAERLAGRADVAAEVAFREHFVEMGLRCAEAAMNALADVLAFAGFGIPPSIDADDPRLGSAADDLSSFPGHNCLLKREKSGTRVAHAAARKGLVLLVVQRVDD